MESGQAGTALWLLRLALACVYCHAAEAVLGLDCYAN